MPDFPNTSLSLIDRLRNAENDAAWHEFAEIYQPVVYRMARGRGLQDADCLDVVQQVFASISKAISRWEPAENGPPFRAWLATVARNTITSTLTRRPRDRATGSTSIAAVLHQAPADNELSAELQRETRREIIRRAAEQIRGEFEQETWDAFWRTAMEEVSVANVAEQIGKSAGAIYVARHRVLARLKQKIEETSQEWEVGGT